MSELTYSLEMTFLIGILGYCLGRIQIRGIGLGPAGIFLVGLVFGHFGVRLPVVLQTMGLLLFISSVGLSAGNGFFRRLRTGGLSFLVLALLSAALGAVCCLVMLKVFHLQTPLAVGILTGAFTTSPGFAAAKEAVSTADAAMVSAGYAVVYPIGTICKILYVQLIPPLLHVDLARERDLIHMTETPTYGNGQRCKIDPRDIATVCAACCIGLLIGNVSIPLPGGSFGIGNVGGGLIAGLLLGQLGHIGPWSLRASESTTNVTKDLGLLLFFAGAGTEGGQGVVTVLGQYGVQPLLLGLVTVVLPLSFGLFLVRRVLKMPLLNGISAQMASMTCTSSLAALIESAGTNEVAAAYATTYPIALLTILTVVKVMVHL